MILTQDRVENLEDFSVSEADAKAKLEGVKDIRAERFLQTAKTMQDMEEQDKANRNMDSEADKAKTAQGKASSSTDSPGLKVHPALKECSC